jgi:hypothetical protein
MVFLVQFRRFRRGVPEVVRTIPIAAANGSAALTRARSFAGTRFWPPRTDALRVGGYEIVGRFDPGGREPQYAIRNADQSYDRIVQEDELRKDLGARTRGR